MDFFLDLITNPYLLTGLGAWFLAQVMKTIIHAIINKKLVWERLIGDGGMPSGHSATVTSMALFAALRCGANSYEFAIAGILAVIVCHDAMGVRLETGKQAEVILELIEAFEKLTEDDLPEQKLKTFVGHTPVQVLAGIALGIIVALVMNVIL
jgi:acid phosphatase family membrane protein YuiD